MTTPINLNRARKERARNAKKAKANENSIAFGRTKVERERATRETSRKARELDGKILQRPFSGTENDQIAPHSEGIKSTENE